MITLFVEENNPITPNFYNEVISNLPFHRLKCTCGMAGCLSIHAYYYRNLKISGDKLRFRICRVKCQCCGRTHALLLSSMVPYSQISLPDQVTIIDAYESRKPTTTSLRHLDSVDESNIRYIIRQYKAYWKERLLSEQMPLHPLAGAIKKSFSCFIRQLMQIHCTTNILFSYTT